MRRSWMGVAAVNTMVLLLLLLLLSTTRVSLAFSSPVVVHQKSTTTPQSRFFLADSDFSAFANSLEEDLVEGNDQQQDEALSWQAKLESMLDPRTSLAQRQILASELLSANNEIRESVMVALRDRKVREKEREKEKEIALFSFNDAQPCPRSNDQQKWISLFSPFASFSQLV